MKKALLIVALIVSAFTVYGFSKPSLVMQETSANDWTTKMRYTDNGPQVWKGLSSNPEQDEPHVCVR